MKTEQCRYKESAIKSLNINNTSRVIILREIASMLVEQALSSQGQEKVNYQPITIKLGNFSAEYSYGC